MHALGEVLQRQREAARRRRARRAAPCRRAPRSATETPSSCACTSTGEASSSEPRSVGCAVPSDGRRRGRCARAARVRSTATVRVITERLPARSLAISSHGRAAVGQLRDRARTRPRAGCTTTRLPAIAQRERRAGLDAPAELARGLPAGRRPVERQRGPVRVDVDRERLVDAVAEDAARAAPGCARGARRRRRCRARARGPSPVVRSFARGVRAVDARAQAAEVAGVLDRHEHLRRRRAVPLPRRAVRPAGAARRTRARARRRRRATTPPAAAPITRLRGRRIRRI